jgi:hypothetical protein
VVSISETEEADDEGEGETEAETVPFAWGFGIPAGLRVAGEEDDVSDDVGDEVEDEDAPVSILLLARSPSTPGPLFGAVSFDKTLAPPGAAPPWARIDTLETPAEGVTRE